MISAQRPPDEEERLQSLREARILDTAPEREFDDLALIASIICGTPMALVSLVDEDRQWFKARLGVSPPETPRDIAFCAHAILGDGAFVVRDATDDPRFDDNPLVRGDLGLRFYAGAPIADKSGHKLGTVCTLDRRPRDLTPEQVRALEALARQASALIELRKTALELDLSRWQLQDLLDRTLLLVQITERRGQLRFVNRAWMETLGYTPDDLPGLNARDLIAPDSHEERRALRRAIRAGAGGVTTRLLARDGRRVEVEGSISSHREGLLLAVFRDVTELRQVERLRNELVSNVSHELRTPLTSISGALGLLRAGVAGELAGEAAELIELAESNARRLAALVNDILDLEKIGSGRLELSFDRVEVAALVQAGVQVVKGMARTAGVTLECDLPPGLAIRGDQGRLVQVLTNFLSNAVKHSPAGAAVLIEARADEGRVRIAVQDRGPGVPEAERERIFERFRQASSTAPAARDRSGTGLGLAISRGLVERHGGRVGVDSVPGQGSRFWMELPADEGVAP